MRILVFDTSSPNSTVTSASYLSRAGAEVIQLTEKHLLHFERILSYSTVPFVQHLIKKVLQRISPTVIHIHAVKTPLLLMLLSAAKELRIPVVATIHSYKLLCPTTHYIKKPEYAPCEKPYPNRHCVLCINNKIAHEHSLPLLGYKVYMPLLRRLYGNANILIAISQTLFDLFKAIGYKNVAYLPNPVSDIFLTSSQSILKKDHISIGFLGQLKDYKGIYLLPMIAKRFPNIDLHVAGWGPLRKWIIEKSQNQNITFHGYINDVNLPNYIRSLNMVLVPSIYNEACPGVVLEAFAQQKPVICFNLGGQAELVRYAKGGLLAKPFSLNDMCNKIEMLLSDSVKQAELGLNGRKWVERNCSPEKHSRALMGIYEKAILTG